MVEKISFFYQLDMNDLQNVMKFLLGDLGVIIAADENDQTVEDAASRIEEGNKAIVLKVLFSKQ